MGVLMAGTPGPTSGRLDSRSPWENSSNLVDFEPQNALLFGKIAEDLTIAVAKDCRRR